MLAVGPTRTYRSPLQGVQMVIGLGFLAVGIGFGASRVHEARWYHWAIGMALAILGLVFAYAATRVPLEFDEGGVAVRPNGLITHRLAWADVKTFGVARSLGFEWPVVLLHSGSFVAARMFRSAAYEGSPVRRAVDELNAALRYGYSRPGESFDPTTAVFSVEDGDLVASDACSGRESYRGKVHDRRVIKAIQVSSNTAVVLLDYLRSSGTGPNLSLVDSGGAARWSVSPPGPTPDAFVEFSFDNGQLEAESLHGMRMTLDRESGSVLRQR